MNENLAIVGSNALVLDSPEDTLTQEASLIEKAGQQCGCHQ